MPTFLHHSKGSGKTTRWTKMKRIVLSLFCSMMLTVPAILHAANLVIEDTAECSDQIVIPDQSVDEVVDRWFVVTARLMQTAFRQNGFEIPIVRESVRSTDTPGIYLGATALSKKHGITVQTDDWTYVWKTVGQDLVIVGTDRKDHDRTSSRGETLQLVQLGSVKGTLAFLREYVGTRFLFNNNVDMRNPDVFDQEGNVPLGTQSIAYLPVQRIAIPSDLNVKKTPPIRAKTHGYRNIKNFYMIANNYFPAMSSTSTMYPYIRWNSIIPVEKYGETHPEYFALLPNGKRAYERTIDYNPEIASQVALDVTHPEVLDLMCAAAEAQIKKGHKMLRLATLDQYLLVRCNCHILSVQATAGGIHRITLPTQSVCVL